MNDILYLNNTYISSWEEFVELATSVISSDTPKAKSIQEEILASFRDGTLYSWVSLRVRDASFVDKLNPENFTGLTDSELLQSIRDICGYSGNVKHYLRFEEYLELIDEVKLVEDGKETKYKLNEYICFSQAKERTLTFGVRIIKPANEKIELSLEISKIKQVWRYFKEKFGSQNSSYSHSTQTIDLASKAKVQYLIFDVSNLKEHTLYLNADNHSVCHLNVVYSGVFKVNGVEFKMIEVEGGSFMMGATPKQMSDAYENEKPAHKVTLSEFYIGEVPVTQELWRSLMGNNPSCYVGDKIPVNYVNWNDCCDFINKLNEETVNTRPQGMVFRFPTEAEWEYAARGGCNACGEDFKYAGSDNLDEVAWNYRNSSLQPQPVCQKKPNQLGIYDMSGNVWEWCYDGMRIYDNKEQTDPIGPTESSFRALRGGCCFDGGCSVSFRYTGTLDYYCDYYGLRLCLGQDIK